MRTTATAALLGIALLATGCSSSTSVGGTTSSTDVTTTVMATTTAPSTTVPASAPPTAPPTAPPVGCPDVTPSAAAVQVQVINGDWNGDGSADSALSWGEPAAGGPEWYIRMQISGGANSAVALGDLGVGFAYALGEIDLDFALGAEPGVNRDEMIAIVGSNASGYNLGLFGTDDNGCAFQFDNGGGSPYEVPVHAAAATMSGMMCDGGMGSRFAVRLEASTGDGVHWDVRYIRVERTDQNSLADGVVINDTIDGASAVAVFGQAECDGTMFIGPGADY